MEEKTQSISIIDHFASVDDPRAGLGSHTRAGRGDRRQDTGAWRTKRTANSQSTHVAGAWATANGSALGQVKTDDRSN